MDAKTEAQLTELTSKRSSMKGQVTKFSNYLSTLDDDKPLSDLKANELTLKLNKIIDLATRFDELQMSIEVINNSSLDSELTEREVFEDKIHLLIATAQCTLDKVQASKAKSDQPSLQTCATNCNNDSMGFQLPQIKIAKFDGSYYKWMEFKDIYESLIHTNDRIKAVHKFHYLNSYLEGEASRVISNLEVSAANYPEAWELLCERYGNKRQLITNHLNSLLNFDVIRRESDKALRFLSDHMTKNLRALETLGLPTQHWDAILIHLLSTKLDPSSSVKWEEYRSELKDWPTLKDFKDFLKNRADILETLYRSKSINKPEVLNNKAPSKQDKSVKTFVISAKQNDNKGRPCVVCRGDHRVYDCPVFRQLSVDERWARVNGLQLCHVCLRADHESRRCKLSGCRVCKRRHNTYLHTHTTQHTNTANPTSSSASMGQVIHPASGALEQPAPSAPSTIPNSAEVPSTSTANSSLSSSEVLLSTALIDVINPCNNRIETVKALLDCGSQSSYMSDSLKQRLQLPSQPLIATTILGIGNTPLKCTPGRCSAQIHSKINDFNTKVDFLVLDQITDNLPKKYFDLTQLNIPANIQLADPTFNVPSHIDVLLGADIFWHIVGGEQKTLNNKCTRLISSKLGYLIAGPVVSASVSLNPVTTRSNLSISDLSAQISRFWETEELPFEADSSYGDAIASHPIETHFVENTYRQPDGRFVVRMPLIDSPDCLGSSYHMAKKRLLNLEKRFQKQPELKDNYNEFIDEYKQLGHLSESQLISNPNYLPHHPVIKEQSESTKLRVVFDASCPTSSGYSINNIQMVGPCIQDSLYNILLRFRHYKYVLSGDIEKQYRQILMNELDRYLQVILWREDEHLPIRSLTLNTVTYGFASASFLAARCLWQLGEECIEPLIKTIIQNYFYCDDLLTGADSESDLLYIQTGVAQALEAGCFNLRKYRSNATELLISNLISSQDNLTLSQSCQTLGLGWNPSQDLLNFSIDDDHSNKTVTKRSILSITFKIFDPLGLLSLCTVKPKMLMQKLWAAKVGWDDPAPPEFQRIWARFIKNLHHLKTLNIPRQVLCESPSVVELHCFSDSSQDAYCACVYVKSISCTGKSVVNLLCAKDRVAPMKPTTIPRLELSGALLAVKTYASVSKALRKPISRVVFWTDSAVVLAWLKSDISKLKVFIANRVAAITDLAPTASWRHVPSAQNPADLGTRGVDPQHVASAALWWHGPEFLLEPETNWPTLNTGSIPNTLPELKITSTVSSVELAPSIVDFDRFSKFKTLQRAFAYVQRFINNSRPSRPKLTGVLTSQELTNSFHSLIKLAQQQLFHEEIQILHKNKQLNTKSHISSLTPFIDSQGILRVGGRLDASHYSYDKKHPMLLLAKHTLTQLIMKHEHIRLLHAGPQLLLTSVRDTVWPVGGRCLARSTARNCVTCRRAAGRTLKNIMGNLPPQRLNPDFPFAATAVDFGGPFLITDRRGRGCKITKCYLCLFVCLRYKCVHLEAVSELSKDAFILALRRFIARRGKPTEMLCDNGRNFVAAAKEINEFVKLNVDSVTNFAADQNIRFKFTPAYAPNHNGYVEACIKMAKFHLKRIMGNTHLTFEELSSLFSQIEAILNSRPLCPLSSSPDDFSPLTPGHFLVGRALMSLPTPSLQDHNPRHLDRFKKLEQLRQHFWTRWSSEYVSELQQRVKWRTRQRDLQLGELVLIKDEALQPLHWRMGRVVKLHPGTDGVPRVADIATARGPIRRALNRICPLRDEEERPGVCSRRRISHRSPSVVTNPRACAAHARARLRYETQASLAVSLSLLCAIPLRTLVSDEDDASGGKYTRMEEDNIQDKERFASSNITTGTASAPRRIAPLSLCVF
ncbi:hypothetical protein MSG28_010976 [Choristoneura fumiferana]|uniref:Uncharacterized protein n=1 Tax=Choristoneura fumiferana TaxID=7141 RepID=A0ACC0KQ76_CHOFU|nr:hypothetical protein MSG28_010976 [Choristoneura fumiferana]